MSDTQIEWTHRPGTIGAVWNPVTGCNKVDRGCKHCYAETMHRRLQAMGQEKYESDFLNGAKFHMDTLDAPLKWKKPRTVFVNSMSDLFHIDVPFEFIDHVLQVIGRTPQHLYLILTKRPERAAEYWRYQNRFKIGHRDWRPPANMWIGTSVNDQNSADVRVPYLLQLEATIRFISYEPATGPVDLTRWLGSYYRLPVSHWRDNMPLEELNEAYFVKGIDWLICGGESGHHAQPMHPDWVRRVRDDCLIHCVPFFFKQWGHWVPHTYYVDNKPVIKFDTGKTEFVFTHPCRPQNMRKTRRKNANELDGRIWQQFPEVPVILTEINMPCPSPAASTILSGT